MSVLRRCLLVAALLVPVGCRKAPEEPHGSPVLLQVVWEVDGTSKIVWSTDADAAVAAQVPPGAAKIDFVYDRRLDGARVEDTVDDAPVPKTDPPVTVAWPDMTTVMSDPPFAANVFYNSVSVWGPGTSYVFVQPKIAGFPSDTAITFTLDPNGLTSAYGDPMTGPTTVTVMTAPLTLTLPSGTATVPTNYVASIAFSTRAPAATEAIRSFIQVTSGGTALAFDLQNDASDSRRIFLSPVDCGHSWPAGARVDVRAIAGLPDAFGRPLAAAATGSFITANVAATTADGGCAAPDGGVTDGGVTDGGVTDDGSDAAIDAAMDLPIDEPSADAVDDVQSAN